MTPIRCACLLLPHSSHPAAAAGQAGRPIHRPPPRAGGPKAGQGRHTQSVKRSPAPLTPITPPDGTAPRLGVCSLGHKVRQSPHTAQLPTCMRALFHRLCRPSCSPPSTHNATKEMASRHHTSRHHITSSHPRHRINFTIHFIIHRHHITSPRHHTSSRHLFWSGGVLAGAMWPVSI